MHIVVYTEEYLGKSYWKWFFKKHGNSQDIFMPQTFETQAKAINNAKNFIIVVFEEVNIQVKFLKINISPEKKIIKWEVK